MNSSTKEEVQMIAFTTQSTTHTERVKSELKRSGVSSIALLRFTGRYLPKVIHENEHIKAAVFGRHKESEGLFGFAEGMLVATDIRIIYLDHRPGYTTMDEISYDVVSGVNVSTIGLHSSLTLFTKIANYTVSFAKLVCVRKFADYIEKQRIDFKPSAEIVEPAAPKAESNDKTLEFLRTHDTAVLSTIERTGNVTGAVVFYIFNYGYIYILTKDGTRKARNMVANSQVALTIYDAKQLQTAQIQGFAEVELDPAIRQSIYERIAKPYNKADQKAPPVTKIQNGSFIVFRITPENFSFSDFSH